MRSIAFIFDMDGVIINSNPFHKIALQQFCEKYGYHLSEDELHKKIYGRTNQQWITNLFGRELELSELHQLAEEKENLFRNLYKNDITALAGLEDFLKKMDNQHIARAIGTSAPRSNVDFVMTRTGLAKYFSVILDDSFVKNSKPDPEIYLKCAAKLGFRPADCIVFEDSLSGIAAGKAAGAKVVGVTTTHPHSELVDSDYTIPDFVGIYPAVLIQKLFG